MRILIFGWYPLRSTHQFRIAKKMVRHRFFALK